MSVPEGQREEGKFTLLIKAEALARYTLQITSNDKIFLSVYQRALTDDIIEQAKNSYIFLSEANDVQVRTGTIYWKSDLTDRLTAQEKAVICLKRLLRLIDLAYRIFHLDTKRVKYWGSMVIDIKNRTRSWMSSDAQRYIF